MFAVVRHGGSVGRLVGSLPWIVVLAGIASGCALSWSGAARAGTLYQCVGSTGETVFSSSRAGYRDCKPISNYASPAPRRAAATPRAALTRVRGSVVTTAQDLSPKAPSQAPAGLEPRTSLAWVRGSVQTSARVIKAAEGKPGQWSYRETADGAPPEAPLATSSADRVLRGAVYRVVRGDGSVEYTNLRPAGGKGRAVTMLFSYIATCVACNLHSTIRWGSVSLNLTAYADTIHSASADFGVDEAFLRAIIHAESAFNPRALSLKGAQGLMQLMPATASDMGVHDAFDSDQNIRGGARYLALLLRTFNGDERLAAAAYNAGPGAVQRYQGVPPYAETQVYVERVGTLRRRYGEAIHPPLASRGAD